MAASDLGLSGAHEQLVVSHLTSSRRQRSQSLKTIEATFKDFKESRLNEDTYTRDEVEEMLDSLSGAVNADVGSELINSHHTSALLLRQLLQQADKWYLQMTADISAMENRELLDEMAKFEDCQLTSNKKFSPSHKFLEPLNTSGGDSLLRSEIKRLEEENMKLKDRLASVQTKATSALSEKDKLKNDLLVATASSATSRDSAVSMEGSASSEELASLQARIEELQTQLSECKSQGSDVQKEDLAQTAHSLLKVSAELERTKQELEEKFSATAQYQNMRKMLTSKNEQIKELRSKLKKYESGEHVI